MSQTQLEKCLEGIKNVFYKYSEKSEPYKTLSKAEFTQLMKEQLPKFFEGSKKPQTTNGLFKELDQNEDGEVSFEEFVNLLSMFLRGEI